MRKRRREWAAYLSHRMWILGALLAVLSVLALVQYRWIGQLTQAQLQRRETNLIAALSSTESDFDVEFTRAVLTFQDPIPAVNYAQRYEAWLRHAPYPNLIRGVYLADAGKPNALPTPVIAGEPIVRLLEWNQELPSLSSSYGGIRSPLGGSSGFQVFTTSGRAGAFVSHRPEVTVDGNPAMAFPLVPSEPVVARRVMKPSRKMSGTVPEITTVRLAGSVGPTQWAIVVFDADYMSTTFLPSLVQRHFGDSSSSEYEVTVVSRDAATHSNVVFPTQSRALPAEFGHPDGKIDLFKLRLDCFSPSLSATAVRTVGPEPELDLPSVDDLTDLLARSPAACSNPTPAGDDAGALWELLVKHRNGSLDQAMATFRRRNLLVSGSVLLVLALGVSMAVLLTERARALAEMQTEFVLGVSHELRTPLTVITVAADNLTKGMVENRDDAYRYGTIIATQAAELSNMVEETLTLARMGSEVTLHHSCVQPERMVKDVLADNESALCHAGFKVEVEVPSQLPSVNVDVPLIKRCLGNLIQNAIKYAAAGHWLAVRARTVTRRDRDCVEISVEDRGPGISAKDLPHIFEPFYRGRPDGVPQVAGMGLGLSLVKRAVEAHAGAIEVQSSNVTRFSIFLPAQAVERNGYDRCGR